MSEPITISCGRPPLQIGIARFGICCARPWRKRNQSANLVVGRETAHSSLPAGGYASSQSTYRRRCSERLAERRVARDCEFDSCKATCEHSACREKLISLIRNGAR